MTKPLVDVAQEIIRPLGIAAPDNECGYVSVGIGRKSIEDNIHNELVKEVIPAVLEAVRQVKTAAFVGKTGLGNE